MLYIPPALHKALRREAFEKETTMSGLLEKFVAAGLGDLASAARLVKTNTTALPIGRRADPGGRAL